MATKKSTPAKSASAKSAPAKSAAKKSVPAKAASTSAAVGGKKTPASHQQISELAHKYFTERGYRHGHHQDDWFRAEKELNS